jgi:hypothetical protein
MEKHFLSEWLWCRSKYKTEMELNFELMSHTVINRDWQRMSLMKSRENDIKDFEAEVSVNIIRLKAEGNDIS